MSCPPDLWHVLYAWDGGPRAVQMLPESVGLSSVGIPGHRPTQCSDTVAVRVVTLRGQAYAPLLLRWVVVVWEAVVRVAFLGASMALGSVLCP